MAPRRRRLLVLLLAIFIAAWVAANAAAALVIAVPVDAPDAIVSLASHEWERLPETARRAAQSPRSLVLLTLPSKVTYANCYICSARVAELVRLGVARDRIRVLPIPATGTYGEALACRRFAAAIPIRRLLVVTSPYHTRRSLAVFRAAFAGSPVQVGVEPAATTLRIGSSTWWLAPYDRWYVLYEWAATVYYAWEYGVFPALR